MNRDKFWDRVFWIALILVLILILIVTFQVIDAKKECLDNPFVYGAQKLTKENGAEFSCTCSLATSNSPRITFDSKDFNVEFPNQVIKRDIDQLNLSEFVAND